MERKTKNLISKIAGAVMVPTFILAACISGPSDQELIDKAEHVIRQDLKWNSQDAGFTGTEVATREEVENNLISNGDDPEEVLDEEMDITVTGYVHAYNGYGATQEVFYYVDFNDEGELVDYYIQDPE